MLLCRLLIVSKSTFLKNYSSNTISVSNNLDPDQARHLVGPDLGSNSLHRLSTAILEGKELPCSLKLHKNARVEATN